MIVDGATLLALLLADDLGRRRRGSFFVAHCRSLLRADPAQVIAFGVMEIRLRSERHSPVAPGPFVTVAVDGSTANTIPIPARFYTGRTSMRSVTRIFVIPNVAPGRRDIKVQYFTGNSFYVAVRSMVTIIHHAP